MRKALFTLAVFASAFIVPLTAHADTIDDFMLVGQGHTITYSLPATSTFPNVPHFNSFTESASTTVDSVSTSVESGQYFIPGPNTPRLLIGVPSSVFGIGFLEFSGPVFFTLASDPLGDVVPTFTPGTYTLESLGPALQPFSPPAFYTLTITQETSTAPTPEPASLTLLATGTLGIISVAARRRKARQVLN
jgi:hypothetical protein